MSNATRAACGLVFASLLGTGIGAAQGARLPFGLGGGVTMPTGAFHADSTGEGFNPGWQAMVLVHLKLTTRLGIRLDGTYGENSANDKLKSDLTALLGQPSDANIKLTGGNVDLTYEFSSASPMKLYLLGGVGMYKVKYSVTSGGVTRPTSETKFSTNAGAGLIYAVGGAALFLEARYVDSKKAFGIAKASFFPITAGVRFGV